MSQAAELFQVFSGTLPKIWPDIAHYVEQIADGSSGRYAPEDIRLELETATWQLWVAWSHETRSFDAVAVTQIVQYPRRKAVNIVGCVGHDRANWTPLLRDLERWASEQGATLLAMDARPGWERVLKPHGYAKRHVCLEREL